MAGVCCGAALGVKWNALFFIAIFGILTVLWDIGARRAAGGGPMQIVRSSATVGDTDMEALYFLAIASAKRSIELTAAYFVPRPAFTEALCDAAERGVLYVLPEGTHGADGRRFWNATDACCDRGGSSDWCSSRRRTRRPAPTPPPKGRGSAC